VAQISIPGGSGNTVTFTVTGNSATNYATAFNTAVATASVVSNLGSGDQESTVAGALNIITSSSNTLYSLTTPGQYTYAAVTTPTRLTSATGSQTVLGGGGLTYVAGGGSNNVTFLDGDNFYAGQTVGGNINTGTGSNTVFSGTGNALINLTDTVGGDVVGLFAGHAIVNSAGANDVVFASAAYDSNTTGVIFGGSGNLLFIAGPSESTLAVSIAGGSGTTDIFGGYGSDIVFASSQGLATYIAGAGNETLNAFNAHGNLAFFGNTVSAEGPSINDTVVGGTGTDFFSTGGGNETFFTGTGPTLFDINDLGPGTDITIANFGAADYVNFAGLGVAAETALLQNDSTASNGNLTVTLQNGTQVEFVSATSLTGHLV
jgi:hypothetical protein